jgi:NAD(P)-dependent dehydrogenase (short-subunit alcohol dehydrogenase family)
MSTDSKIVLITGGNRGLGRSAALHLAAHGTDVIFTYRSGKAEAEATRAEIARSGRKVVALPLDVTDPSTFPAFIETLQGELQRTFGRARLDYLVNNAGAGAWASFTDTTAAVLDAMYNLHVKGPFLLTQKLLPLIADGGRILNVSTGLARFSLPGYAAYAMMKGAVEVMTRYMAVELGARKISVNTIAPGAIETDFSGGAVRDNKDLNAMIAGQTALGRVGLPDDIGGAVDMLLGPNARWINGQRIEVSGGIHL